MPLIGADIFIHKTVLILLIVILSVINNFSNYNVFAVLFLVVDTQTTLSIE